MKRSKKYKQTLSKIDSQKRYTADEALSLLPEISYTKFPGSVELKIFLNLNEKQKKESIRGSYTLPHSFGKSLTILAIVDKSEAEKAKDADIVGGEELFKDIEGNKITFDMVITTPMMMPKLARLGKVLGSKGLMPNPKNGTITNDLPATIKKFKKGLKNFKSVNGEPINAVIGKTDMSKDQLKENMDSFMKAVMNETKKFNSNPIKRAILTPTMGPKLEIDTTRLN
jgi:large subunit ribosomal protein L1